MKGRFVGRILSALYFCGVTKGFLREALTIEIGARSMAIAAPLAAIGHVAEDET